MKFQNIVCILATNMLGLEKFLDIDQHPQMWPIFKCDFLTWSKFEWLSFTSQWQIVVLSFIPESLDAHFRPFLWKWSLLGRAQINCLEI